VGEWEVKGRRKGRRLRSPGTLRSLIVVALLGDSLRTRENRA
jgi:hypothetical protein